MKTRVHKLKDDGVACAWFHLDEGEVMEFEPPSKQIIDPDDPYPIKECRTITEGRILYEAGDVKLERTPNLPLFTMAATTTARFTGMVDGSIGFCFSSENPTHNVIRPYKHVLKAYESVDIKNIKGYLTVAHGSVTINGNDYTLRKIIKLSGTPFTINAGSKGAIVAILEVEFLA